MMIRTSVICRLSAPLVSIGLLAACSSTPPEPGPDAQAILPVQVDLQIVASVSGQTYAVTLDKTGGDPSKHPAFSLTTMTPLFLTQLNKMAAYSQFVTQKPYANNAAQLAEDYAKGMGSEWSIDSSFVPSCWTPEGWEPPGASTVCRAYPLLYNGSPVYQILRMYENTRVQRMYFYVSVKDS